MGAVDQRRLIREEPRHGRRRLQIVLGVRLGEPAGSRQGHPVPNAGDDVLEVPTRGGVIEHLGRRYERDPGAVGMPAQTGFLVDFLRTPMPAHNRVEAVAERLAHAGDEGAQFGIVSMDERAPVSAPQRDHPFGVVADLGPGDTRLSLRPAQPARRDQPADVRVPGAVHRQQHTNRGIGRIVDRDLGADDEVHAELARLHMGPHHAVDAVAVRQRERPDPEGMGLLDQLVGVTRPFEKREVALAPERDVTHSTCPCQHQRRRGRS